MSALGYHALYIVRSLIRDPHEMMVKLDEQYDSKSTANRISKLDESMSKKYTSTREDISQPIDRFAVILN